ncbi:MAG: recombination mediator RecR [Bacilli bacterium]
MLYPEVISNLIECYKKLPGIGEKTAERMALYCLELDQEVIDLFAHSLKAIKTDIKRCKKCNNLSDKDICSICSDKTRDNKTICVVEDPKNVFQFEKIGSYHGLYHVLDGLISPLDNVNPEDINLQALLDRIKIDNIKEVIIAVKPSIEGETTALYVSKILENEKVMISKIAHGVPLGADMDYVDALTLELALDERKNITSKIEE